MIPHGRFAPGARPGKCTLARRFSDKIARPVIGGRVLDFGAIDQKIGVASDLVVQRPRHGVRRVGVPIDTAHASAPASFVNSLDQLPGNAVPATFRQGEEVLKIAGILNLDCVSMKNEMRQPGKIATSFRDKTVNRF